MTTGRTTTERGLGWAHQKRRAALLAAHVDGTACPICRRPMHTGQGLDADHTVPRSKVGTAADRLAHATCNRSRGDRTDPTQRCQHHVDCWLNHSRPW